MYDLKIVGGEIADGVADKRYKADLGIKGDKIVKIGDLSHEDAAETIDATGKIVAPGFIDIHTHSDVSIIYDHKVSSKIHDGVTTEVIGNCGIGVAPIKEERKPELIAYLGTRLVGSIPVKLELPWNTMAEYLKAVDDAHTAVNVAPLVAQGAIRINEMGFAKGRAAEEQMENMQREVTIAMKEGCVGISSGLVYMPGEYSSTDELAELCTAVAPYKSFYVTHMRSEGNTIFEAIDEAINVAKQGGVALHISHLKLAGSDVRGQTDRLFGTLEKAQNEGLDVTFDAYPYDTGCTSLGACMPPWTFEGGTDKMIERVSDPETRKQIIKDIEEGIPGWQNFIKSCGSWENITIATVVTEEGKSLIGKTIGQIAAEQNRDPFDVVFDTIIQEKSRVQILNKMMDERDVDIILSHPGTMIGSDGMSLSMEGLLSTGKPHPRAFGTRARVLAKYVREKGLFSVEQAVKKMSAMPAARLKLANRGTIKEGNFADITIFDPETVQDNATFADPKQYSSGFKAVIVNGKVALLDDKQLDVYAGHVVRRSDA